ncbi:MAG: serine hydrolase [Rubrobacter sp.]|nr:serine hydrolase [Rubrobacter sp.]
MRWSAAMASSGRDGSSSQVSRLDTRHALNELPRVFDDKIVTATVVLRLGERGNLNLDAPVAEYFADFSAVSQPVSVTARHLLNHSSGLESTLVGSRSTGRSHHLIGTGLASTVCWPNTAS